MELKFKQFIKTKGIDERKLPVEILSIMKVISQKNVGNENMTRKQNEEKYNKTVKELSEVDNSLIELLEVYLENPDMNFSELMKEDDFEETFVEVKEQVAEIKVEAPAPTPTPTPTPTKNSKEDILGELYTAGQTKVKAETLKGAGYPMGFFDDIYSGTGKYKLKKSLSGLYEITLR